MDDLLGFFSVQLTDDKKGFMSALLVTDAMGIPQEFRVTFPVRPTPLQVQLYGKSLIPHIGVELCAKPLFGALNNRPSVVVISDPLFLPLGDSLPCPVAFIRRLGDTLRVNSDAAESVAELNKLDSGHGRFQPLAVDYPPSYDQARRLGLNTSLRQIFVGLDLVEPFGRIKVALDALAKQDERFQ
jgi:hypothetical protein